MKKIGFLNFGHWTDSPQSAVRTASDALLQSIDGRRFSGGRYVIDLARFAKAPLAESGSR